MAQSSIEWTMKVWNPTTGCNKVSQGCKNCYAEKMHKRLMVLSPEKYAHPFLAGAFEHEASLQIPFKWRKPATIFVNSMSDLFHESLSVDYIAKVYAVMFLTARHTYQVLTKRPERRLELFKSDEFFDLIWKYCNQLHHKYISSLEQELYFYDELKSYFPFANVWEGTSIEDQETIHRADILRNTPAHIRWISAEPLLEDLGTINLKGIDWVVVGGESGHKKRPFNSDWARSIRDYCEKSGTKFFMKQIDKVQEIPEDLILREYPN